MARIDNSGPTDRTTPCDVCGSGTYTFASGSIWCPMEDPHPGGHFVKRVAFEASPTKTGVLPLPYPKRDAKPRAPKPVAATPAKPKADDFSGGYDDFVKGDR
jgi:hypothetical protein